MHQVIRMTAKNRKKPHNIIVEPSNILTNFKQSFTKMFILSYNYLNIKMKKIHFINWLNLCCTLMKSKFDMIKNENQRKLFKIGKYHIKCFS